MEIIHRTGDVDPLTYGGGVVVFNNDRHEWWFWDELEESEHKCNTDTEAYTVSTAVVEDDMLSWYDWPNLKNVARHWGIRKGDLKRWARGTLQEKVHFLEAVKAYYGAFTMDQYPIKMTAQELASMFGLDSDARDLTVCVCEACTSNN